MHLKISIEVKNYKKFDFGYGQEQGYANTKGKPLYGDFDVNYYKQQTLPNQSLLQNKKNGMRL